MQEENKDSLKSRYNNDEEFRNRIKANMKRYYENKLKNNQEYQEKKNLENKIRYRTKKAIELLENINKKKIDN